MTATVERLSVEPVVQMKPKPVFTPEPEKNVLLDAFNSLLPVFSALAAILAIRLFLLLAIIGSFVLAYTALGEESYHGLWILVAYCTLTVLPLVWLDTQGKKKGA